MIVTVVKRNQLSFPEILAITLKHGCCKRLSVDVYVVETYCHVDVCACMAGNFNDSKHQLTVSCSTRALKATKLPVDSCILITDKRDADHERCIQVTLYSTPNPKKQDVAYNQAFSECSLLLKLGHFKLIP